MAAPDERQLALLTKIDEKLRTFGAEYAANKVPEWAAIIRNLEKLHISVESMDPDQVTPDLVANLISTNPSLSAPSLIALSSPMRKQPKKREEKMANCTACGSSISDGVCTNPRCSRTYSQLVTSSGRGKSKDPVTDKLNSFLPTLDILLGITVLPCNFLSPITSPTNKKAYTAAVNDSKTGACVQTYIEGDQRISPVGICKKYLQDLGYSLTEDISSDTIREAMRCAGLRTEYIWATGVKFYLTGRRPAAYGQEERELWQLYYARAVHAYHSLMTTAPVSDEPVSYPTNFWNIQAFVKLILDSSVTLKKGHIDFFDSLHKQNSNTEEEHCRLWAKMAEQGEWTFK